MKKLILSVCLMLMVPLCFCQEIFPRKILIESDTLVLITIPQAKKINVAFSESYMLKKKNKNLSLQIGVYKNLIANKGETQQLMQVQLDRKDLIIDQYQQKENVLNSEIENLTKNVKSKNVKIKRQRTFLLITSTVAVSFGFLFVLKGI